MTMEEKSNVVFLAPEDWRQWMRALGSRLRHLREFLGLSQEQLAKLSGVSQGAVSRLETGRGRATPLLIVVKVESALRQGLRQLDPALLSAETRQWLDRGGGPLIGPPETAAADTPLTRDPGIEELIRLYHDLPGRSREAFRAVVRAAARALVTND